MVTAYALPTAPPCFRRRFHLALVASLMVHALMVVDWSGAGSLRPGLASNPEFSTERQGFFSAVLLAQVEPQAEGVAGLADFSSQIVRATAAKDAVPAPQFSDSDAGQRYYSALELDHYPAPLVPLENLLADVSGISGQVRLLLRIDLFGRVVDLTVLAADPPGAWGAKAREHLLQTRFTPARKDERPVNSRIVLELRAQG